MSPFKFLAGADVALVLITCLSIHINANMSGNFRVIFISTASSHLQLELDMNTLRDAGAVVTLRTPSDFLLQPESNSSRAATRQFDVAVLWMLRFSSQDEMDMLISNIRHAANRIIAVQEVTEQPDYLEDQLKARVDDFSTIAERDRLLLSLRVPHLYHARKLLTPTPCTVPSPPSTPQGSAWKSADERPCPGELEPGVECVLSCPHGYSPSGTLKCKDGTDTDHPWEAGVPTCKGRCLWCF
jgi:hypothetical protein